ncbi:hypothetical protein T4D_14276 [Trichinella pseudospiralis]|uniref:Uncharacterized protein n=1 Tax=Trichinella pseudospiralis TaxID=6337 RepID=A0A0V1F4K0_TRIPS|nr:hypothetical protein T4D_14276 [Trichinella pseudospiralis]
MRDNAIAIYDVFMCGERTRSVTNKCAFLGEPELNAAFSKRNLSPFRHDWCGSQKLRRPLCRVPSNKRPTILSRSARYYQRLFTLSFGAKAVYCPPTLPIILHPQSWVSTCQHYKYFNAPFSLRLVLIWYQYTWFAVQGSPRFLIYAASVFLVNSTVFSSANHKQFCGAERGITHALSRFPSVPAPSTLNKFFTIFLLMRDFSKQHFTLSYTPGFPITPLTHFYPPQSPAAVLHQQLDRRFRRCAAALPGKLRIIFVRIISPLKKLRTSFCRIHNSASTSIYLICCSALSETVDMQKCSAKLSLNYVWPLFNPRLFIKKNTAVVTSFPLCPRICYPPKHLCYCRPALCCVTFEQPVPFSQESCALFVISGVLSTILLQQLY